MPRACTAPSLPPSTLPPPPLRAPPSRAARAARAYSDGLSRRDGRPHEAGRRRHPAPAAAGCASRAAGACRGTPWRCFLEPLTRGAPASWGPRCENPPKGASAASWIAARALCRPAGFRTKGPSDTGTCSGMPWNWPRHTKNTAAGRRGGGRKAARRTLRKSRGGTALPGAAPARRARQDRARHARGQDVPEAPQEEVRGKVRQASAPASRQAAACASWPAIACLHAGIDSGNGEARRKKFRRAAAPEVPPPADRAMPAAPSLRPRGRCARRLGGSAGSAPGPGPRPQPC